MIFIITISYLVLLWLIDFRLRLLPFNLTNKIGVALAGVVLVVGLVLATNYCHTHSSDVRVTGKPLRGSREPVGETAHSNAKELAPWKERLLTQPKR